MITFTELLERAKSENIAVHTPTEEQAITLLKALDKRGYEWCRGYKLTEETHYEVYKEDTCYALEPNNTIYYSLFTWYQRHDYTIIEFGEIDFKESNL